ncbi:MAG: hypothetical protein R3B57_04265 [Phycisphaerales bacterium]
MGERPNNPSAAGAPERELKGASEACEGSRWHEAAAGAERAMNAARQASDFETLARATVLAARALSEIRAEAIAASPKGALIAGRDTELPDPVPPGCYLLQPPMVGADATRFRDMARAAEVPVMVLTREPLTRAGLWPVVSVGRVIVRARIQPPAGVKEDESRMTRDNYPGPAPLDWFLAAHARLGEAALERIDPDEHPHHRVDDLLELFSAIPEHPAITAALVETAREAAKSPKPTAPRWRPVVDDPYSF